MLSVNRQFLTTHTNRLFSWSKVMVEGTYTDYTGFVTKLMHPWECLVILKISAIFQTFLSGLSPMQNMSASASYWESPSPPAWMSTNNWDVWLWPNQTFLLLMACCSNNLITYLSSQHDMPLFSLLGDEIDRQMHHIKACNLPSKLWNKTTLYLLYVKYYTHSSPESIICVRTPYFLLTHIN